ncbi:MAG: Porphobilinogen deaminase [Chlamydiales bacterium]|nr:Porphobilinogen deaminase [Chlamydiales bacterium]MCH9619958.1 Porphobilinogen deaminase [Chlamydiales bacterium]MCH9622615.1 Porphobilinogen deaminase [Chlamydiales bacterium]
MLKKRSVSVAARDSKLSCMQVKEVEALYPMFSFEKRLVKTRGDHDQKTSLREMDKTDFFTREIDQMLLKRECDLAIHSAKDLPDPLPDGLEVLVLTEGVDSSDSLVVRGELKKGMVIATSSQRREEAVKMLCPSVNFVDIRGTIEMRLAKWERGEVDGVVLAEAALIRLGLTHLPRVTLPGPVAKHQGRLAIVGRRGENPLS